MSTFSLITFNCFGVPGPVTHLRLHALAQQLDAAAPDVVCLQEVQVWPYHRLLRAACAPRFPHSASAPHIHAPRGGLLSLAQQPMGGHSFIPYRDRGLWYSPALADVALSKGILRTEHWCGAQRVVVLNTHLSANYRGDWQSENPYLQTERRQLAQLAEVMRHQPEDALVVACGDFNVPRGTALYDKFVQASGALDPLAHDQRPSYRPLPGIPARFALPIDYTFVRAPALPGLAVQGELCFGERVRLGRGIGFLSDHIGVRLEVRWG